MKFAILSLVAAGGLAATAGSADAQYRGYGNYRGGYSNYNRGYSNYGNYNRGYSNYYGGYGSGTTISIGRPGGIGVTIGSGNVYPSYYGGYGYNRPYYGGGYGSYYRPSYGYGYGGRRW